MKGRKEGGDGGLTNKGNDNYPKNVQGVRQGGIINLEFGPGRWTKLENHLSVHPQQTT